MSDGDGAVWLVFNGELYNFRELRHELQSYGFTFRSATDTECVVHLYRHFEGAIDKVLARLRGMFALGIWDTRRDRLTLARDRLGIKPLYWAATVEGLAFCSEQRGLVRAGLGRDGLSDDALAGYLAKGVVPGGNVAALGVNRLGPGELLTWENGTTTLRTWWRPILAQRTEFINEELAQQEVSDVIQDAVERHLVADRAVGIFLSTGTDSSAIATLAARSGPQRSLTVTFPDEPSLDEAVGARATAHKLGFDHLEIPTTGSEVAAFLPEFVRSLDSPSADALNSWLVCRAAADAGLVVALSGLGGDELFAGYETFQRVPMVRTLVSAARLLPAPIRHLVASAAGRATAGGPIVRALEAEKGSAGAYHAMRSVFTQKEIAEIGLPSPPLGSLGADPGGIDAVTMLELTNYLPDQLLADTDSVSMSHSLEVRVPLLDDEVVRVALSLPPDVRASGKTLLAKAAALHARPPKRPFALPLGIWMKGALRDPVRAALLDDDLPLASSLPRPFRERTWSDFAAGRAHWSRPWSVALLRLWCDQNAVLRTTA